MKAFVDPETRYQLPQFMKLYQAGVHVQDGRFTLDGNEYQLPITEDVAAFGKATGLPVVLVSPAKHNELIPYYKPFFEFYKSNQWFWMIPCEVPGKGVTGFVLSAFDNTGLTKKQKLCLFHVKGTMPIVYGLHGFGDFKMGSPIILTEGVKDALFLTQHYPYVLGVLTNSISEELCEYIEKLTSKVVLAFDTNKKCRKHTQKIRERFSERGMECAMLYTSLKVKDWANFFSADFSQDQVDDHIHLIMSSTFDQVGGDAALIRKGA